MYMVKENYVFNLCYSFFIADLCVKVSVQDIFSNISGVFEGLVPPS